MDKIQGSEQRASNASHQTEKINIVTSSKLAMPRDEIIRNIRVLDHPEADDEEKSQAAQLLASFAQGGEWIQSEIAEEGGLMPLVALLEGGPESKSKAAFALRCLAKDNDKVGMAIVACGGREGLEALANCKGTDDGKDHALEALKLLPAEFSEPPKKDLDKMRKQIEELDSRTSDRNKGKAAKALGDLAQQGAPTQQAIEAAGALEPLVDLLSWGDHFAKMNAAYALRWLAFNNLRVSWAMVVCGAREPLQKLENAEGADDEVRDGRINAGAALKCLPACSEDDLYQIRMKVQVLRDPNSSENQMSDAAMDLGDLALHGAPTQLAIEAAKALPLLVAMLYESKRQSAAVFALRWLATNNLRVAKAIVACGAREPLTNLLRGDGDAQETLKLLPDDPKKAEPKAEPKVEPKAEPKTSGEFNLKQLKSEMKALETGSKTVQCKAAEQLGSWAAMSDEKRAAINKAGGCEALVALVVYGSEDAKWHAARALRNLANHAEAKENILKADGIAILTPIAKHGKGKAKEAASEALNLLSLLDSEAKPPAEPAATSIPSGAGTRVAMFSARFDGGPIEKKLGSFLVSF